MDRLKQLILVIGIAAPLMGAFGFGIKVAMAADAPSSTLVSVDSANLAPEEKLAKAKEDLTKALDLSLKKVESLKTRLNELNFPPESREQELKTQALKELDDYARYYNETKGHLDKATSLDEVKELARQVKEYRDTTYTSGVEKIVKFISVFYNEEILGVANDRRDKIEGDIKKLDKFGVIKEGDFRKKLDETGKLLKEAAELQGDAKQMILSATSTTATTKNKGSSTKEMIEQSFNNVKTVYGIFLELNQEVKKALGL